MSLSDPVADMLTRIRNAQAAGHKTVAMPHSRVKGDVARILKNEGYIADYTAEGGLRKMLTVYLKYTSGNEPVIRGLRRESCGGLRRYCNVSEIPKVLGGLGVAIVSTSAGIMTDRDARQKNVGGEVLCTVW